MAVHVRYNSCYISLPSSAKQQREMTKFGVAGERDQLISNSFFHRRCCGRRRRGYLNSLLSEGRYLQDLLSTVKFSSTLKGGATLLRA